MTPFPHCSSIQPLFTSRTTRVLPAHFVHFSSAFLSSSPSSVPVRSETSTALLRPSRSSSFSSVTTCLKAHLPFLFFSERSPFHSAVHDSPAFTEPSSRRVTPFRKR